MSETAKIVAGLGDIRSYHGLAASEIFGAVALKDCSGPNEIMHETRYLGPEGMGVMAVQTAHGPVAPSLAQIMNVVPDVLPTITARADVDVSLVLVSAQEVEVEELARRALTHKIFVHANPEAWRQSEPALRDLLQGPRFRRSNDNVRAAQDIIALDDPDHLAIAPAHAVESLGVNQIGEEQLNPPGSRTRFYGMQLDPRKPLTVPDDEKTAKRVVMSITHPEYPGAIWDVLELSQATGVELMDFIRYPENGRGLHGGIFEIAGDVFDPNLIEFAARMAKERDIHDEPGGYTTRKLGSIVWYPETPLNLDVFADRYDRAPDPDKPLLVRD